jgi:hypothetical protein
MADDKTWRSYRSNDPYRDAEEVARASGPASDPLAELARLIGQGDPFAELGRGQARPAQPVARSAPPPAVDDRRYAPPPQQLYGADGARVAHRDADAHRQDYAPEGMPRSSDYRDPRGFDQHGHDYAAPPGYPPPEQGRPEYGRQDYGQQDYGRQDYAREDRPDYIPQDFIAPHTAGPRPHASQYHASQQYGAEGLAPAARFSQDQLSQLDPVYADDQHAGDPRFVSAQPYQNPMPRAVTQQQVPADDDDYQDDDAPLSPHDDQSYDDAPRARGHSGLVTALALIGCAMLGTVGAYAYRSYTSPSGTAHAPPVITADRSTPTKIVPTTSGNAQPDKSIQDRVAVAGGEQLVSKQEEPVAVREIGTATNPRTVLPSPFAPASPPSSSFTEPKSVRTVPIRPDGTDTSGRPVGALPLTTQSTTARPAPAPTPPAPKAAPPPTRSVGGGPISLEPSEPAPAPRARTAALPPAAESSPEPSRSTGGYVVQLASQKSEADAQAAFKSLQAKFPNELGGRQPIIRRADLGSKGIFYRAMVGPFPSQRDASQFCEKYKAAGGQCFMPSN